MIANDIIMAFTFNVLFCFALPFYILTFLSRKGQRPLRPFLVGAGVFVFFQMILRIPLLNFWISPQPWFQSLSQRPWLFGLFLGLTAGLFEELGRFSGFSLLLKNRHSWYDGLAFGAGHGGIEAILLVGLQNINNLVIAKTINAEGLEGFSQMVSPEVAQQLYDQMTQLTVWEVLLGSLERGVAMTLHIGLSLLVLHAIRTKRPSFILLAIALHGLIDAPIVILPAVFGWSILQLEIFLFGLALLSLLWIVKAKTLFERPMFESLY